MSKHTPGPWTVRVCSDTRCVWPQVDGPNDEEIIVSHAMMSCRIEDANARLIAAAPELLAALQEMLSRFGGATDKETPAEKQARAAIAKATGPTA